MHFYHAYFRDEKTEAKRITNLSNDIEIKDLNSDPSFCHL